MKWGLLFSIFLITFLVACSGSDELTAKKLTKDVVDTDVNDNSNNNQIIEEPASCENIICQDGFVCEEGECVCKGKLCGTKCILDGCCIDSDCSSDKVCINNKCEESKICEYHEIYDREQNKCVCEEDYFFCENQNICIKDGDCCHEGDCDRYTTCIPSSTAITVCVQYPNKKMCKLLRDILPPITFDTPEKDITIKFVNILSGGITKLKIDNQDISLGLKERRAWENATIWVEEIQPFGGQCREE